MKRLFLVMVTGLVFMFTAGHAMEEQSGLSLADYIAQKYYTLDGVKDRIEEQGENVDGQYFVDSIARGEKVPVACAFCKLICIYNVLRKRNFKTNGLKLSIIELANMTYQVLELLLSYGATVNRKIAVHHKDVLLLSHIMNSLEAPETSEQVVPLLFDYVDREALRLQSIRKPETCTCELPCPQTLNHLISFTIPGGEESPAILMLRFLFEHYDGAVVLIFTHELMATRLRQSLCGYGHIYFADGKQWTGPIIEEVDDEKEEEGEA